MPGPPVLRHQNAADLFLLYSCARAWRDGADGAHRRQQRQRRAARSSSASSSTSTSSSRRSRRSRAVAEQRPANLHGLRTAAPHTPPHAGATMPLALEEEFLRRARGGLVVGCAIDGSALADRALAAACAFVQPARGDRLVVLHVADSSKAFLPRHLQPGHLQDVSLGKAFEHRVPKAEWACVDRHATGAASTCEALMALAQEQAIDLLVVGSFGRKGEGRVDMLGTVSDYSLRAGHASVAIVRSTAVQRSPGSRRFLFATDTSRAAAMAFCTLCHQIARPGDEVVLVSCSYEHSAEPECFEEYKRMAAKLKIACEALVWRLERSQSVADGLLHLVAVKEVDTLVCGISGYSQKKLGSVSDEITHHATCNTVVIKDPREVLSHQFASAGARGLSDAILPVSKQQGGLDRVSHGLERTSHGPGCGHGHARTPSSCMGA